MTIDTKILKLLTLRSIESMIVLNQMRFIGYIVHIQGSQLPKNLFLVISKLVNAHNLNHLCALVVSGSGQSQNYNSLFFVALIKVYLFPYFFSFLLDSSLVLLESIFCYLNVPSNFGVTFSVKFWYMLDFDISNVQLPSCVVLLLATLNSVLLDLIFRPFFKLFLLCFRSSCSFLSVPAINKGL